MDKRRQYFFTKFFGMFKVTVVSYNKGMIITSKEFSIEKDWYELWTDGSQKGLFNSWADLMSYQKSNELLEKTSAIGKFFKLSKYQRTLLSKYTAAEDYIKKTSPVGGVLMVHTPKFHPDSLSDPELVYVDYYASLLGVKLEGASYESMKADTIKEIAADPSAGYVLTETTELGHPTLLVTYLNRASDGTNAGSTRQYTMFPVGKPYGVQLFVQTPLEEFNTGLEQVAKAIIAGVDITE